MSLQYERKIERIERTPPPPPPPKKKRFPWWTLAVIVMCLGVLASAWVYAESQFVSYDAFNEKRAVVSGNVFFGPVSIDGITLTGMTMDEAREALNAPKVAQAESFAVTLTADGETWRISSEDIPMAWDTESLLQKAYMVGRVGSLEQRYQQVTSMTDPVTLTSTFTYDKDAVKSQTDRIASYLTEPSSNATVVAFDVGSRSFTFTDEKAGQTVDANNLYQTVIDALDNGEYGTIIGVHTIEVPPAVTRTALESGYTRIATYTTKTTDNANRNTNIDLAAQALNGKMIEAGGELSFNETTGQRTVDKGYKEAGAIENGRTVQEVGGGVCQVSTTLFNALVRAECEIVSRKPHAWPSDYVPRGEDAAVDWPGLDLVMRNPTGATMFLAAWYEDQTITVEVYGLAREDGLTVDLASETTYSKEPTEIVYTYNENLAVGKTELLKKPRTGYSVQTYKIYLQNGEEVSRETLYKSEYRMINEEYEYNDGKGPPPET